VVHTDTFNCTSRAKGQRQDRWCTTCAKEEGMNSCVRNFYGTGVWTQGLHLELLYQSFVVVGFSWDRVSRTICLGWLWWATGAWTTHFFLYSSKVFLIVYSKTFWCLDLSQIGYIIFSRSTKEYGKGCAWLLFSCSFLHIHLRLSTLFLGDAVNQELGWSCSMEVRLGTTWSVVTGMRRCKSSAGSSFWVDN
jgi:hypothetical protein